MDASVVTPFEKQLRSFLAAFRFLTIVPVARGAELDGDYFKQSLMYFPIIGMLIGGVGALIVAVTQLFLPQPVVVCIAIAFLAFISGCLHLDGLSDSGDGLLSSRPRERSMEIMKDSRVGAMGVIVTLLVLLAKYSALTSMESGLLPAAVFLMPFAGRVMILCTMALLPYARKEGGLGGLFYTGIVKRYALLGVFLLLLILFALAPQKILPAAGVVIPLFWGFNLWCKNKLGGATGDTLGANCELAETCIAIAFSSTLSFSL